MMMVDLIRVQECWKARKNINDIWARLKSVLIYVEFVGAGAQTQMVYIAGDR